MKKKIIFICLIFILVNIFADDEELKIRLQYLENQVRKLTEEVFQLKSTVQLQDKLIENFSKEISKNSSNQQYLYEDIIASYKKDEISFFDKYKKMLNSHLWIGGYFEQRLESQEGEKNKNILELSSLGIIIQSSLSDFLSFKGEFIIKKDKINVLSSHAIFSFSKILNFKVGVTPIPLGYYNISYQPPLEDLTSIPLINQYIVPYNWSEPAIGIFGIYSLLPNLNLNYELIMSNGLSEKSFNADKGNREGIQELNEDNNSDKQWTGRLGFTPNLGVEFLSFNFGNSFAFGKYDENNKAEWKGISTDWNFEIGYFSLISDHDKIKFRGEFVKLFIDVPNNLSNKYPNISDEMQGFYLNLSYSFFPENWKDNFILFTEESNISVIFRYEYMDLKMNKRGSSEIDDTRIYTLGINFSPIEKSIFKIEYSWIREIINTKWAWNNRLLLSFSTYF